MNGWEQTDKTQRLADSLAAEKEKGGRLDPLKIIELVSQAGYQPETIYKVWNMVNQYNKQAIEQRGPVEKGRDVLLQNIGQYGGIEVPQQGLSGRVATPQDSILDTLLQQGRLFNAQDKAFAMPSPGQGYQWGPGATLQKAPSPQPYTIGGTRYTGEGKPQVKTGIQKLKDGIAAGTIKMSDLSEAQQRLLRVYEKPKDEEDKGLTPAQQHVENQRKRNFMANMYGINLYNNAEPDVAARILQSINQADEIMAKNPGMTFNKAAQMAFMGDPNNMKDVITKQYPEAYQGADGKWYLDKDGKTYPIIPKK